MHGFCVSAGLGPSICAAHVWRSQFLYPKRTCEIHVLSEVSIVAIPAGKPGFFLYAWRPRLGCFMLGSRARSLPPDSLEQVYAKPAMVFLQCVATSASLFVCRGPRPAPCCQIPCNKMYLSVRNRYICPSTHIRIYVLADERALCRAPSCFWSAASHHPFALPCVRHIFPSMAQQYDAGGEDREGSPRPLHEPCQPRAWGR